jgi:hypothetical protein
VTRRPEIVGPWAAWIAIGFIVLLGWATQNAAHWFWWVVATVGLTISAIVFGIAVGYDVGRERTRVAREIEDLETHNLAGHPVEKSRWGE